MYVHIGRPCATYLVYSGMIMGDSNAFSGFIIGEKILHLPNSRLVVTAEMQFRPFG